MSGRILAALLVALVLAAPATASFTDHEPDNDSILTAPISFTKTGAVSTRGGKLTLFAGDIDFLGIAGLSGGDIVTVSVTPLDDPPNLEDPDTIVGLFDSTTVIICRNDEAFNSDQDEPPIGSGSLCRFSINGAGDYYVGVTGYSETPFDGMHSEDGEYSVTISVYGSASTPTPTPTSTPFGTPTATPTGTPTATPTATPTGAPSATPTATPSATPTPTPTPEPGVMLQLVVGGAGLAFLSKRRLRKNRRVQPKDDSDRVPRVAGSLSVFDA